MNFTAQEPRKKLRLAGYNYKSSGLYFVTFCTEDRQPLFGEIINGKMEYNDAGYMVFNVFKNLKNRYFSVDVDNFVIMPNHVHAIIILERLERTWKSAPTDSLSDVIKKIKTYTTRCYMQGVYERNWIPFDKKLWQRGYYEHIIRDEISLNRIREYILNNPLQWEIDHENTKNT